MSLHSQVSIDNGLYLFSDYLSPNFANYPDRLASSISINENLPDLFQGIQTKQEIRILLKNVSTWTPTPAGTVPIGDEATTYDVTASDIMAGSEQLIGKKAWGQIYDLSTSTVLLRLDGIISRAQDASGGNFGMEEGEILVNVIDLDAFQQQIPKVRLLDRFPNADTSTINNGGSGQTVPVFVAFGAMRKVSLAYLGIIQGRHCFGAF